MEKTFLIKKNDELESSVINDCHDGSGPVECAVLLEQGDTVMKRVKFVHRDVLPPGASIGSHDHADDEEYYIFTKGNGVMVLDGNDHQVEAGELTAVFPGGSHGLRNDSDEDLHFLVICVE